LDVGSEFRLVHGLQIVQLFALRYRQGWRIPLKQGERRTNAKTAV